MKWPKIILGGMGVAVSWWWLVRSACIAAQEMGLDFLGIVSLTAIGDVAARRLQLGDKDMLRALAAFPIPEVAVEIRSKYYIEGGKGNEVPFKNLPLFTLEPSWDLIWINIFGAFAEVWLAKEGHEGKVGINILEKIQLPIIYLLLGAMWAGADAVVVGAGLPLQIPEVINAILDRQEISYRLTVAGDCQGKDFRMRLNINELLSKVSLESRDRVKKIELDMERPWFFPVVTLFTTAKIIDSKIGQWVDGHVVEESVAGGHNAAPRDKKAGVNEFGEPIYGVKDNVDYARFVTLDKPFWPAGGFIDPEKRKAIAQYGPAGFQIGGPFGICDETSLDVWILAALRNLIIRGQLEVLANPNISSSGYPFQTASIAGTIAEVGVREARKKRCNLAYLRQPYCDRNGNLHFRCSAEDPKVYVAKGGRLEDTIGKGCLCNGLTSTVGLGQVYLDGYREPPIVTFSKTGHEIIRRLLLENNGSLSVKRMLLALSS